MRSLVCHDWLEKTRGVQLPIHHVGRNALAHLDLGRQRCPLLLVNRQTTALLFDETSIAILVVIESHSHLLALPLIGVHHAGCKSILAGLTIRICFEPAVILSLDSSICEVTRDER